MTDKAALGQSLSLIHISAFPHQAPGGAYPVEVAIDVQFHQVVWAVRGPARGRGRGVLEPQRFQAVSYTHLDV